VNGLSPKLKMWSQTCVGHTCRAHVSDMIHLFLYTSKNSLHDRVSYRIVSVSVCPGTCNIVAKFMLTCIMPFRMFLSLLIIFLGASLLYLSMCTLFVFCFIYSLILLLSIFFFSPFKNSIIFESSFICKHTQFVILLTHREHNKYHPVRL